MSNFLEKFFEFLFAVLVCLAGLLIIGVLVFIFPLRYKKNVINELCQKQQYDFCEVDKITYKLKDSGDGTIHK